MKKELLDCRLCGEILRYKWEVNICKDCLTKKGITIPPKEVRNYSGKEIAELVYFWLEINNIHPDDYDCLFANELLERMERDR